MKAFLLSKRLTGVPCRQLGLNENRTANPALDIVLHCVDDD